MGSKSVTHTQRLNSSEGSTFDTPEVLSVIDDSDFVKNTLEKWELSNYIEVFQNEKIGKQVLLGMPDETVVQLMPTVGDHTKFLLNRKKYLSQIGKENHQNETSKGEELKHLLQQHQLGKVLLDEKNIKNHSSSISHIIINHIWEENKTLHIDEKDFTHWATEIKSLWKNEETDFWYQKHKPDSRKSGTLYHTYKNELSKIRKIKKKQQKEEEENNKEIEINERKFMEGKIDEITKRKIVDDTFLDLWAITWNYRQNEKLSTDKLFQKYSLLNPPTGEKIIIKEFQLTAKNVDENLLKNKWKDLSSKIVSESYKNSKRATAAIQKYVGSADDKVKETLAWRALPFLITPVAISTQIVGKKSTRVTYAEQSNGFIRWINNITEIDVTISKYEEFMDQFKLHVQPYIIAVGRLDDIKSAYVIINRKKFPFKDVTSAVDFAWKATIAFNLKYAEVCKQIWVFIENYIYGCDLSKKNFSSVKKLIGLLNDVKPADNGLAEKIG